MTSPHPQQPSPPPEPPEGLCHCGRPVHVHADLDEFTRGLCLDCDLVRCDAYPGSCTSIVEARLATGEPR
jgi:hypothetical protein